MTTPLISIITLTYNHENFIDECISSVKAQSYENWEMIIIDDGSTDQTKEIIKTYKSQNHKIHFISQDNKGPGRLDETYNCALKQCSGEWIAILEGDDYWLPHKLEKQYQVLDQELIFCYGAYLDKINENFENGKFPPFQNGINIKEFIPYLLMHESFLIPLTWIIKKASLISIGGFHQDRSPAAVDMATLMNLIKLPGTIFYQHEVLGVWRHHQTQSTLTKGLEIAKFNAKLVHEYINNLSKEDLAKLKIEEAAVYKKRKAVIAGTCFSVIRRKLLYNDRKKFILVIKDLWCYGNVKQKFEAIVSLIAYILHLDVELPLIVAKKIKLLK